MKKTLSYALAMAGLTCVLSVPVMAATSTASPSGTSNSTTNMGGSTLPPGANSSEPSGTNGANTNGTALPGSGGEAGSGGNSSPGNSTPSGAGSGSGSGGSSGSSGSGGGASGG